MKDVIPPPAGGRIVRAVHPGHLHRRVAPFYPMATRCYRQYRSRMRRRSICAAALLLCLAACESSTSPKKDDLPITFGSSIAGTVARGDTVVYRLNVEAGQLFVVYVDALDSAIVIQVVDQHGVNLGGGNS